MGKLEKIWIKRFKAGPMDSVLYADFIIDIGIKNNADQNGKRQVTIIEKEKWHSMMKHLKCDLDPSARRANLLISSIPLKNSRGKILNIGNCSIKVCGETKPCERMDGVFIGLKDAMKPNWNGGIFGIVIKEGTINVGDEVVFD